MNPHIQELKTQLSQTMPNYSEADVNSVLEMLYSIYRRRKGSDSQEVSAWFDQLDTLLRDLSLKEYGEIWDVACGLCCTVEKEAFLEGIRVGACLASELGA